MQRQIGKYSTAAPVRWLGLAVAVLTLALVAPTVTQAQVTPPTSSASVEVQVIFRRVDVSSLSTTPDSTVRRQMGISIADYFNADVYSTTIIFDPYVSVADAYDPVEDQTTLRFLVRKGSFIDWTGEELALIFAMPDSPIFYKTIADNIEVDWVPLPGSSLLCASTVICRPNDLFGFIANPDDAPVAKQELMDVSVVNILNTNGRPVPEPTSMSLAMIGIGTLLLRRRGRMRTRRA